MSYGIQVTVTAPFGETVGRVREALAAEGFGVLSEIDVRATMRAKLDLDVGDYLILGACNPPLAYRALQADESIGLLLPCNVVVRAAGDGPTVVEALDPQVMVTVSGRDGLRPVAEEAAARLRRVLEALAAPRESAVDGRRRRTAFPS